MGLGFLAGFGASVLIALAFSALLAWGAWMHHEVDEGGFGDSAAFAFAVGTAVVILVFGTLFLAAA